MDKQPPFDGWNEGLSAYKPVIKDEKLYGKNIFYLFLKPVEELMTHMAFSLLF